MEISCYLTLEPKRGHRGNVIGAHPYVTTKRPGPRDIDPGAVVVRLRLTLPDGAFEPIDIPIEVPEEAVVKMQPIVVEAPA